MNIILLRDSETMRYAAEELQKYLCRMDGEISATVCTDRSASDGIALGHLADLSLSTDGVQDAMTDDVIDIDVQNLRGYIAGSNDRSVLMGVYDFLKLAGCQWVRPGEGGEYIPQRKMRTHSMTYRKKADHPFRGECIEGAVSFEHVRDTILWLPKVNMNLFMMEQVVPYNYMSRWYKHEASTVKQDENVSFEEVSEMILILEKIIKKCGLQLHALGHGYLLEPYGIHYKTRADKYVLTEEAKQDIALINGERKLFQGSPNFTQLCFSKEKARLGLVKFLVEYLQKKPYIDFLHVWLSDSVNNHCECENCQKYLPSDLYVQMLNELDAELTAHGIDTKIVFIAYTDTNWPPEVTRFINPERFILTTNTKGTYPQVRSAERSREPLPPFVRNRYNVKGGWETTLSFLDAWRELFAGPSFLYDYYFYTAHYLDPGHMDLTRQIYEDVQFLETLEFDGLMSDQTQRSFFPTGLPLSVLGETLFDKRMDRDAYTQRYFSAAYGADAKLAREYLEEISRVFEPNSLDVRDSIVLQDTGVGETRVRTCAVKNNPQAAVRLSRVKEIADGFLPTVEKNRGLDDPCHKESWKLLYYHTEYVKRLAEVFIHFANGQVDAAKQELADMVDYLSHIEDEIHPQFDLVLFKQRISQILET